MFRLTSVNGVPCYKVTSFEETGLVDHCITTRMGGVSGGCYSSLNLRFNCDDERANVIENFRIAAETAGAEIDQLVLSRQVHEAEVVSVGKAERGNGVLRENAFESADGLITDEPGVALVTLYADCVPLLFLDKRTGAVASVHSGWKGTVKRIGAVAVRRLCEDYGSRPEDILCAIGPSIQEDHFEVGDDVAEIFIKEFGSDTAALYGSRYHVNMQRAIIKQLMAEGVPEGNIENSGLCTYCCSDVFFSHRKTSGRRGNFAAIIMKR